MEACAEAKGAAIHPGASRRTISPTRSRRANSSRSLEAEGEQLRGPDEEPEADRPAGERADVLAPLPLHGPGDLIPADLPALGCCVSLQSLPLCVLELDADSAHSGGLRVEDQPFPFETD